MNKKNNEKEPTISDLRLEKKAKETILRANVLSKKLTGVDREYISSHYDRLKTKQLAAKKKSYKS